MTDDTVAAGWSEQEAGQLTAVRLMRLALPLLDRSGNHGAVAHLQHAIDLAGGDGTSTEEALRLFEVEEPHPPSAR